DCAQEVSSRSTNSPTKLYFPILPQTSPDNVAILCEDGSVDFCNFCIHSLDRYESSKTAPPENRMFNITKTFICAVCGVKTYWKRIRALSFQKFPFLAKTMQPGSFTIGKNRFCIVCLDCSETLWSQSTEYDRWGLPVHKRYYNWMTRPPPPENSWESCVARLPSGEIRLPRNLPIVPSVISNKGLKTVKERNSNANKSWLKARQITPTMKTIYRLPTSETNRMVAVSNTWSNTNLQFTKDSLAISPEPQRIPGMCSQRPMFSQAYTSCSWKNSNLNASKRVLFPHTYPYGSFGSDPEPTTWPLLPKPVLSDFTRHQTHTSCLSRQETKPVYNNLATEIHFFTRNSKDQNNFKWLPARLSSTDKSTSKADGVCFSKNIINEPCPLSPRRQAAHIINSPSFNNGSQNPFGESVLASSVLHVSSQHSAFGDSANKNKWEHYIPKKRFKFMN
ncbi:hypothetical protein Ocin01_16695, partial [Orchesella cincta]